MQDLLNILALRQLGQHILGSHRHFTLNDCQACGPQSPKGNQNKSSQHGAPGGKKHAFKKNRWLRFAMKLAQMAAAASGVRRPSGKNDALAKLKPANAQVQSEVGS